MDSAKKKHQAALIDEHGLQLSKPFTFKHNYDSFNTVYARRGFTPPCLFTMESPAEPMNKEFHSHPTKGGEK
ncbi:MAG: hypothetical protein ACE5JB_12740 [bacterium]